MLTVNPSHEITFTGIPNLEIKSSLLGPYKHYLGNVFVDSDYGVPIHGSTVVKNPDTGFAFWSKNKEPKTTTDLKFSGTLKITLSGYIKEGLVVETPDGIENNAKLVNRILGDVDIIEPVIGSKFFDKLMPRTEFNVVIPGSRYNVTDCKITVRVYDKWTSKQYKFVKGSFSGSIEVVGQTFVTHPFVPQPCPQPRQVAEYSAPVSTVPVTTSMPIPIPTLLQSPVTIHINSSTTSEYQSKPLVPCMKPLTSAEKMAHFDNQSGLAFASTRCPKKKSGWFA